MAVDPSTPPDEADTADRAAAAAERIDRFVTERLLGLSGKLPTPNLPVDRDLAEEVDALDRLSRLRDKHFQRAPARHRGLILGLFVLTGAIVTVAIFVRVPAIPVELEVNCTAVSFRTERAVQFTRQSGLNRLVVTTFAPTELEDPVDLRRLPLIAPLDVRPSEGGSLTLSAISIPAGARVTLQKAVDADRWRLDIEHSASAAAATIAGSVLVGAPGLQAAPLDFGHGAGLDLRAATSSPERLQLEVSPHDVRSFLAGGLVHIEQLSFDEIREEPAGDLGIRRVRASSVIGGSLFNQSLGGRETKLRQRTTIELDVISGQLSELRLEPSALHVTAAVNARDLEVGIPNAMATLRPSWLEWLAHHHTLRLLWGSAAWVLALLVGGIRWWRKHDIS